MNEYYIWPLFTFSNSETRRTQYTYRCICSNRNRLGFIGRDSDYFWGQCKQNVLYMTYFGDSVHKYQIFGTVYYKYAIFLGQCNTNMPYFQDSVRPNMQYLGTVLIYIIFLGQCIYLYTFDSLLSNDCLSSPHYQETQLRPNMSQPTTPPPPSIPPPIGNNESVQLGVRGEGWGGAVMGLKTGWPIIIIVPPPANRVTQLTVVCMHVQYTLAQRKGQNSRRFDSNYPPKNFKELGDPNICVYFVSVWDNYLN